MLRGEVYKMGIVFNYQDGTQSPVYHIDYIEPVFNKVIKGLKKLYPRRGPGLLEFMDDGICYPSKPLNSLEKVTRKILGEKNSMDMMIEYINQMWYDRIPGQVLSPEHTLQYNETIKSNILGKILKGLKSSKLHYVISDYERNALASIRQEQEMTLVYGRT